MQETSTYLSLSDVARILGVTRMTVNRWVHAGTLPASRFGGVWRVARDDFEAFKTKAKAGA